uniref:Uncharacterized protein n=1 Tax=Rhizophora mucronata TaxID=61149 RepID=A0A2P2NS48_RHIMU
MQFTTFKLYCMPLAVHSILNLQNQHLLGCFLINLCAIYCHELH